MNDKPDFKRALRTLADDEGWGGDSWDPRRGEHPPVDALSGYVDGELDPALRERIQEHLTTCAACTALVVDRAAFPHLPATDGEPGEFEIAAGWRDLQRRLAEEGVGQASGPGGADSGEPRRPPRGAGSPRTAWAAAAGLLIAVLVLGVWNLQLDRRIDQLVAPQANVPIADLDDGRTRSSGPEEVAVDMRGPFYVLLLYPSSTRDFADVRWRIENEAGRELHSGDGMVKQDYFFTLRLHRDLLEPGSYRVSLTGVTKEGDEVDLGELPFRIPED